MSKKVDEILERTRVFLKNDHFVYSSGKHGSIYVNKNDLFAFTRASEQLGKHLAEHFRHQKIDTVAGPAMCGIIPAHWVAFYLSMFHEREVFGIFAERGADKEFEFKRGFDAYVTHKRVLIIDDIATSGNTLRKFRDTITALGGEVVGAGVMVNRNVKHVNSESVGMPLHSLSKLDIPAYDESECHLCKSNVPINRVFGHGKEYLERKGLA